MKRWLTWLDYNKGTEFWSSLIDGIFDFFSGKGNTKAGRWFRNIGSKDGQEPKNSE